MTPATDHVPRTVAHFLDAKSHRWTSVHTSQLSPIGLHPSIFNNEYWCFQKAEPHVEYKYLSSADDAVRYQPVFLTVQVVKRANCPGRRLCCNQQRRKDMEQPARITPPGWRSDLRAVECGSVSRKKKRRIPIYLSSNDKCCKHFLNSALQPAERSGHANWRSKRNWTLVTVLLGDK